MTKKMGKHTKSKLKDELDTFDETPYDTDTDD